MWVFRFPIVESENDVEILLGFGEFYVGLIGDEEGREVFVIGDAFIEEAFLVSGASVGLIAVEDKDAGYEGGSGGRMDVSWYGSREVD